MPALLGGIHPTHPTISAFPSHLQNIDHSHPYLSLGLESHSNPQLGGYLPYDPSLNMGMGVPPMRPSGDIPVGGLTGYQSSSHDQPFPMVQPIHMGVVHSQDQQHQQGQNGPPMVETNDWISHPANMDIGHSTVMTHGGQQIHVGGSVPAVIPHQDIYNVNHLLGDVGITASNMNMGFSHTMTGYPQDGKHDHGYDIGAPMGDHSYDHIYNNLGYGGGLYDPHLMTLEHSSKTGYL
ncbi:hypothetical protein H0H93_015257 [Arthromyces matolae]|nr:hypothetical protein H0H93_015257 [Arthromyces matolae]